MFAAFPVRFKKIVGTTMAAAALITVLNGCSAHQGNSRPQSTKRPIVAVTKQDLGDAVAGSKKITDELGTYTPVRVNPQSPALELQDYLVDKTALAASGFTMAQIADAQRWLVTFIATQGLDSVAVDRGSAGWQQWQRENAMTYLDPQFKAGILATTKPIDDRAEVIMNDANNTGPVLIRDGGPRIADEDIKVAKIQLGTMPDKNKTPCILMGGDASAAYRATDATILKMLRKTAPSLSNASLKREYPNLANGKDGDVQVQNTLMYQYTLTQVDDGWRIAAINNRTSVGYLNLTE